MGMKDRLLDGIFLNDEDLLVVHADLFSTTSSTSSKPDSGLCGVFIGMRLKEPNQWAELMSHLVSHSLVLECELQVHHLFYKVGSIKILAGTAYIVINNQLFVSVTAEATWSKKSAIFISKDRYNT